MKKRDEKLHSGDREQGLSKSLQTRLTELEKEHEELAGRLSEVEPHSMKLQLRDARRFVEARRKKLHSLSTAIPVW